ncbi:MAG: pilin [Candidatus Gracilibacteria bacterium]|nr:pilin [Candidatus Gracilibacteria bacterium]
MRIFSIFLLSFFSLVSYVNASWLQDVFQDTNPKTPYCQDGECSLSNGIKDMHAGINDIEKDRKASTYIQDIIKYLLGFITLVAVIYIIYAGFQIMISAGAEDKVKKSKTTIFHVLIGIVVIWLSYSIVTFIMNVLNSPASGTQ